MLFDIAGYIELQYIMEKTVIAAIKDFFGSDRKVEMDELKALTKEERHDLANQIAIAEGFTIKA